MFLWKQSLHQKERYRPPQEQDASEYRFLALAQESADVFWILTPAGRMQEIYPSWQTFTGQEARDCLGRGWLATIHPADQPQIEETLLQAVISGHITEMECHIRRYDGASRLVHVRAIPVRETSGAIRELVICGNDISRKESAGQMSEAQMQLAIKAAQVGMWDWDLITNELMWTDQKRALFGLSPDTPVSYERFLEAVHPDDREQVEQRNARGLAEKQEYCKNYRTIWPDGSIHWLSDRARGIYDAHGQPTHIIGATVDITELKQAEQCLQEANQQTLSILESITDGFMHLDAEWRCMYVNQRMAEIIGRRREDLLGQCLWDMVPELLGTPFEHCYREAMATQQMVHFDARHPTFQRWLDAHVYPTREGLTVYLQDITERKQAEEALQESEARFRGLVESNLIGITVSDLEGTIHEANEAFLELLGYTQEDLAAGRMQWAALTPPEYQARYAQTMEELLTTGIVHPHEKEYVTKDGRRVPVLVGRTLFRREGSSPLAITFVVDLTARKEIERQKDLFLGMTGHELKTPLAALRGTLQLVQRRMKRLVTTGDHLSPEMRTFFDGLTKSVADSVRQIDVQTRLINDLLDASRITANTLQLSLVRSDLNSIVRQTVEDLRVTAPERALLLELPGHIAVHVLADRDRISQVITNYVTNALRYSSPDEPIHIGLTTQDNVARVWVRDKGPGLAEEAQKELWQRFRQVKGVPVLSGSGKGLGLGLYICQMLIAQHQGEVGVESTPGNGSTFWFTLPLVA